MRSGAGLSLLEVLVSLGLLALVIFSVVTVYTGLLAGTGRADVNREAVAVLDALTDLWEKRIREQWPAEPPPDPPSTVRGEFEGRMYRVDDHGRLLNPDKPEEYLQLKRVTLQVEFEEFARDGRKITRRYDTTVLVSK